ncbi:PepSY domain-containing protein [Paracoccus shandongensis]|uniref:PepSY domain-containing protein n=1 Tax=Paracoccus shandongensis TaxID=2816048 RepID=UPI001A8C8262|nr:PepSY domain-containing protein [Paracoccus shandongensis]
MIPIRALALCLLFCAPAQAQELAPEVIDQFSPLPLHQVAAQVAERYAGRLLAADTRPPRPEERDLGAELVYQFRLVTPQRDLLDIRIDARTGRFLSVSGRGQLAARRAAQE